MGVSTNRLLPPSESSIRIGGLALLVYSSTHFLDPDTEKVLQQFTKEVDTEDALNSVIENNAEKAFLLRDKNFDFSIAPNYFRQFFECVIHMYDHMVSADTIKKDFQRTNMHLNIWGDIVCQKECVSIITPRLFSGDDQFKGVIFGALQNYAQLLKCAIVNFSLVYGDNGNILCRFYFLNHSDYCILQRSTDGKNYDENLPVLNILFPDIDWEEILSQNDIERFSDSIGSALNILLDGPNFDVKKQNLVFVKNFRLYDIYELSAND